MNALLKRFGKLPVVKVTQLNPSGEGHPSRSTLSHRGLAIKPRHKKHE